MEKNGVLEDKLRNYYEDINPIPYRRFVAEAIKSYKGRQFRNIIDIGSGIGTFLESITPFGFRASGIEASDYGLERCRGKGLDVNHFVLRTDKPLPFDDNSTSFVLMNQVIEHLDKQAGAYYISEIVRILEPGGVAIINSPSRNCRIWRTDPHHVYCWRPNELKGEVQRYNNKICDLRLERVSLEPWMFFLYNEEIINNWHKKIKHPTLKRLGSLFFKIADRVVMRPLDMDPLLAVANVSFIKCGSVSDGGASDI